MIVAQLCMVHLNVLDVPEGKTKAILGALHVDVPHTASYMLCLHTVNTQ